MTFGFHKRVQKIGRPVVEEPKTNSVKAKLHNTTHEKLLQYFKDNGISKAEAIQQVIAQFIRKIIE